ncbi:hypothetical protein BC830DRAFT_25070 [Chytriomyces sp. MP71]|nr:hypothetical protein BC830DRAFT_25070 [Chytriomyces sp. MP71]
MMPSWAFNFKPSCRIVFQNTDIRNVVESLFIKAGMKLEPLPISSPILTAAPPQQVRRHSTRTHRRPNTMSTNTDTATKASVLRRMARASSALTAASILPGNKSDSPSASPTLTLSTSSQSSIVSESVSAVPASVAIPIKRTRSCMSTLSNRYVNLSQPKAAALSASEKAKQVLAKKMKALVGDSQTSQASAISVDMDAASAVSNINNTTPVKKIPRTPSSARHSRVRKLLPSGKKIASAMKNMNWDDLEASCMSQLDFVSDSPIKDVAQERPAVKLKVRSARKRIAARMLDVDSLLL